MHVHVVEAKSDAVRKDCPCQFAVCLKVSSDVGLLEGEVTVADGPASIADVGDGGDSLACSEVFAS